MLSPVPKPGPLVDSRKTGAAAARASSGHSTEKVPISRIRKARHGHIVFFILQNTTSTVFLQVDAGGHDVFHAAGTPARLGFRLLR